MNANHFQPAPFANDQLIRREPSSANINGGKRNKAQLMKENSVVKSVKEGLPLSSSMVMDD